MADSKQLKGILAAIATNVIFGFSFIFSKTALSFAEPLVILAVRFTLAFLMINLVILLITLMEIKLIIIIQI